MKDKSSLGQIETAQIWIDGCTAQMHSVLSDCIPGAVFLGHIHLWQAAERKRRKMYVETGKDDIGTSMTVFSQGVDTKSRASIMTMLPSDIHLRPAYVRMYV